MSLSIRAIRDLAAAGSEADVLRCTLFLWRFDKPSYDVWSGLVEKVISYEVSKISQKRADLNDLNEDALTAVLVIALESIGLQASSARVNGNCDVVIGYNDEYTWLGEAKLFTGVSHVWGGYLQLTTRYSSGLPNHNRGGMLLYCQKDNASVLLGEWRATLRAQLGRSDDTDGVLPLTFTSSDMCASTGLELKLTHFAFPLYHAPQENIIKLSKHALSAGQIAKKEARKLLPDESGTE